jgi:hypothetical protein
MAMDARSRFRIVDGMTLIAAVAAGFGLIRFVREMDAMFRTAIAPGAGWHCPLALPLSWAVAALGMSRRGLARRRALRAPGVLACTAVMVASAMMAASVAPIGGSFRGLVSSHTWREIALWSADPELLAVAVVATWATLAVNRRWRPRCDWLDRLGIALGLVWIGSALAVPILRLLR